MISIWYDKTFRHGTVWLTPWLLGVIAGTAQPAIADGAGAPRKPQPDIAKANFTSDEVRADLQELVDKLRARWAYVNEKQAQTGHSLEELLEAASAEVQPTMTRAEVTKLLRRFAGSLVDGHVSIYMASGDPHGQLPFRAIDTVDGVVVAETASGGEVLKLGDRILEIDGRAVEEIVAERGATYPVSTDVARRAHGVDQLSVIRSTKASASMRIERDGTDQVIVCPFTNRDLPWGSNQQRKDWITAKLLTPRIGYLKVRTWMPEKWEETRQPSELRAFDQIDYKLIDAALKPLANATDIIIDVRGNGGGRDQLCCYLGGYFLSDRPVKPYVLRYRVVPQADGSMPPEAGNDGFANQKFVPATYDSITGTPWNTRVWLLVDEGCFSATDTFLDLLTSQLPPNRIHTIGRPSQGGIGGPAPLGKLHNTGAGLTASTCKVISLDGHSLEGHPARIDVPVRWTRADVVAGRDADLETALKLIDKQKDKTN